ncbi:zinc dependent phospholipase C family protein [Lishizhenia sp.]|uniref:zinc dependent phospholipase C family protein n=1 Tax=Lishizhenia sp. TaxID=2497594 RepID=UPI00299EC61F|nr:zinc dependent phospholipase C family protein [Lishizhenia sp.]MDX1445509.1 zinc dependent phospholipase C family protein [Lishizhenia sp.]
MVNWLRYSLLFLGLSFLFSFAQTSYWGFYGHKKINRLAVFAVPKDLFYLYKHNIEFITEHAVDPDKRRYAVNGEAPKHFIDIDHYQVGDSSAFDVMPRYWKDAVNKFSEDTLEAYGIVPWHVLAMKSKLTNAFLNKDLSRIVKLSADIGHYIADAHVPLHTTENYNGQLTGQKGIHAFWESRLPELYANKYDFWVGQAQYISDPNTFIWEAIESSHLALDSVLLIEKKLTEEFGERRKYSFEQRGNQTVKVYSKEFSEAYHSALNGMVERRMRKAIIAVASFWYTAWVDGGQPEVRELLADTTIRIIPDQIEDSGVVDSLRIHEHN